MIKKRNLLKKIASYILATSMLIGDCTGIFAAASEELGAFVGVQEDVVSSGSAIAPGQDTTVETTTQQSGDSSIGSPSVSGPSYGGGSSVEQVPENTPVYDIYATLGESVSLYAPEGSDTYKWYSYRYDAEKNEDVETEIQAASNIYTFVLSEENQFDTYRVVTTKDGVETISPTYYVTLVGNDSDNISTYVADTENIWDGSTTLQPQGSGTEADPYLVATAANLAWIGSTDGNLSAYYKQTADIDLGDRPWNPIYKFSGTYDGGNYVISNVNYPNVAQSGLFRQIESGSVVKNVHVLNDPANKVDVGGNSAAIVGVALGGSLISNCSANVTLVSGSCAAGIVGSLQNKATVEKCFFLGRIEGGNSSGGIVGKASGNGYIVRECFNTGTIYSASENIGGIVGNATNSGTITDCINTGAVYGKNYIGGIVGKYNSSNVMISNCVSGGTVVSSKTSSVQVGGILGNAAGALGVSNNFYDRQVSGTNKDVGNNDTNSEGMQGYATELIEGADTMIPLDFENTWSKQEVGYPSLKAFEDDTLPSYVKTALAFSSLGILFRENESRMMFDTEAEIFYPTSLTTLFNSISITSSSADVTVNNPLDSDKDFPSASPYEVERTGNYGATGVISVTGTFDYNGYTIPVTKDFYFTTADAPNLDISLEGGASDVFVKYGTTEGVDISVNIVSDGIDITNDPQLIYQWYVGTLNADGTYTYTPISGATSPTYTIPEITADVLTNEYFADVQYGTDGISISTPPATISIYNVLYFNSGDEAVDPDDPNASLTNIQTEPNRSLATVKIWSGYEEAKKVSIGSANVVSSSTTDLWTPTVIGKTGGTYSFSQPDSEVGFEIAKGGVTHDAIELVDAAKTGTPISLGEAQPFSQEGTGNVFSFTVDMKYGSPRKAHTGVLNLGVSLSSTDGNGNLVTRTGNVPINLEFTSQAVQVTEQMNVAIPMQITGVYNVNHQQLYIPEMQVSNASRGDSGAIQLLISVLKYFGNINDSDSGALKVNETTSNKGFRFAVTSPEETYSNYDRLAATLSNNLIGKNGKIFLQSTVENAGYEKVGVVGAGTITGEGENETITPQTFRLNFYADGFHDETGKIIEDSKQYDYNLVLKASKYEKSSVTYNIAVNQPSEGGSISTSASVVLEGGNATISVNPALGYTFTGATVVTTDVDGNEIATSTLSPSDFTALGTSNYRYEITDINCNYTITPTFSKITPTVTVSAGAGGTLVGTYNGTDFSETSQAVDYNSTVVFKATPNVGEKFTKFVVTYADGSSAEYTAEELNAASDGSYTITEQNIKANVTVTAVFGTKDVALRIAATPNTYGTVEAIRGEVSLGITSSETGFTDNYAETKIAGVKYGDNVTIKITPGIDSTLAHLWVTKTNGPNYTQEDIIAEVTPTDGVYTYSVTTTDEDTVIVAVFESTGFEVEASRWFNSTYLHWTDATNVPSATDTTNYNVYYTLDDTSAPKEVADADWIDITRATATGITFTDNREDKTKRVGVDGLIDESIREAYIYGIADRDTVQVKVDAVDASNNVLATAYDVVTVLQTPREGFAFSDDYQSGAYTEADGTVPSGTEIIYVDTYNTTVAAAKKNNAIVRITKSYNISNSSGIDVTGSNITIEGVGPSICLAGMAQRGTVFDIGAGDVELNNLEIQQYSNPNTGGSSYNNENGGDGINAASSTDGLFVHNCTFRPTHRDNNFADGAFDIYSGANNITVSYNHFDGTEKTMLIGQNEGDVNNMYNSGITMHNNWFENTYERTPRIRAATVHMFNNLYDTINTYGIGCATYSDVLVEGNYFYDTTRPWVRSTTRNGSMHYYGAPFSSGADGEAETRAFLRKYYAYNADENPANWEGVNYNLFTSSKISSNVTADNNFIDETCLFSNSPEDTGSVNGYKSVWTVRADQTNGKYEPVPSNSSGSSAGSVHSHARNSIADSSTYYYTTESPETAAIRVKQMAGQMRKTIDMSIKEPGTVDFMGDGAQIVYYTNYALNSIDVKTAEGELLENGDRVKKGTEVLVYSTPNEAGLAAGYDSIRIRVFDGYTIYESDGSTVRSDYQEYSLDDRIPVLNDCVIIVDTTKVKVTAQPVAGVDMTVTDENGNAITGAVEAGTKVIVTATQTGSRILSGIKANGKKITEAVENPTGTFTVTYTVNETTVFTPECLYTVTVNQPSTGGTVSANGNFTSFNVLDGTVITLKATAQTGYTLSEITVGPSTVSNGGTYTVTGDVTVTATFAEEEVAGTVVDFGDKNTYETISPYAPGKLIATNTEFSLTANANNSKDWKQTSSKLVPNDKADKVDLTLNQKSKVKFYWSGGSVEINLFDSSNTNVATNSESGTGSGNSPLVTGELEAGTYSFTLGSISNRLTKIEVIPVNTSTTATEYYVIAENNDLGTVTLTGVENGGSVVADTEITIKAEPINSSYKVSAIKVNGTDVSNGGTNTTVTYKVVGNTTITVDYAVADAREYTLTYSSNDDTKGTLAVKVNGADATTGATVKVNDTLEITATPKTGNSLTSLKLNGTELPYTKMSDGTYKVTCTVTYNTDAKAEITATFESIVYRTVTYNATQTNGTLSVTGITDDNKVENGSSITVTATPGTGYVLDKIIVTPDGGTATEYTSSPQTIKVTSDVTITATFKEKPATTYLTSGKLYLASEMVPVLATGTDVFLYDANTNKVEHNEFTFYGNNNTNGAGGTAMKHNSCTAVTVGGESFEYIIYNNDAGAVDVNNLDTSATHNAMSFKVENAGTLKMYVQSKGTYVIADEDGKVVATNNGVDNFEVELPSAGTYYFYATVKGGIYGLEYTADAPAVYYNVTVDDSITNGTVAVSQNSVASGTDVTITATPSEGYVLKTLKAGDTTLTATKQSNGTYTATHTVTADVEITATFEIATYTVTGDASEGGTVTVVDPVDGTTVLTVVNYNGTARFIFAPETGYAIKNFAITQNGSTTYYTSSIGTDNQFDLTNIKADTTWSATFERYYKVSGVDTGLTVTKKGTNDATDVTVTADTIIYATDDVTITAPNENGDQVLDNIVVTMGGSDVTYTTNPVTLQLTGDVTKITATYRTPATMYNVTVTKPTGGTVTVSGLTDGKAEENKTITITATPDTGYELVNITAGDSTYTSSPATHTVTAVTTVTATFKLKAYSVTGTAGTGGTVTPSADTVNHGQDVTLTITPDTDYVLDTLKINGKAVTVTGTTYTVENVTANVTYEATFKAAGSSTGESVLVSFDDYTGDLNTNISNGSEIMNGFYSIGSSSQQRIVAATSAETITLSTGETVSATNYLAFRTTPQFSSGSATRGIVSYVAPFSGKMYIYFRNASGTTKKKINVWDKDDTTTDTTSAGIIATEETATTIGTVTVDITEGHTYYIGASASGTNVYYIEVVPN